MAGELVRVEEERGACRVVMDAGANALDLPLMDALRAALARLKGEGGAPFVLASAHPTVFCPGWDLKLLATAGRPLVREFLGRFNQLVLELFSYPGGTVAAIAGHAIAGGCLLAMACDLRLMAAGPARLGQSEVNLGVPVPHECVRMLEARLAPGVVDQLVLGGDGYSAERAREMGLVHEVAAPGRLDAVVERSLRTLLTRPVQAYREAKRFLHERAWLEMEQPREGCAGSFLDSWFSAETQGRIQALAGSLGT